MIIRNKLNIVILLMLLAGLILSSCAIFAEGIPLVPSTTEVDPASHPSVKTQTIGQTGELNKGQSIGQTGELNKGQSTGQTGETTKDQSNGQTGETTKDQSIDRTGETAETGSWAEETEVSDAAPDQEPVLPKNPATNPFLLETEPPPQPTPEPTAKPAPTPVPTKRPEPTPVPTKNPEPTKAPDPTTVPTTVAADPEPEPVPETEPARTVYEINYAKVDAVFAQTNLARENYSLYNLQPYAYPGADLLQAAALRAREAAEVYERDGTLVSHDRPDGSSCFSVLGEYDISYSFKGENIFWGTSGFSAEEVVATWLKSEEGHSANILSTDFTTVAVGFYSSGGLDFYVQIFIG